MPLTKWINKLETVIEIAENAMVEAVEQSEETLVQLQKDRMDLGLDVNGQPIEYNKPRKSPLNSTGAYTKQYAKKKVSGGGQDKFVDLEKTGTYKKSLKSKTKRSGKEIDVDIVSDVTHAKFIEKNYDDLYGLDERQQKQIESEIEKKIEQKVINHFNL